MYLNLHVFFVLYMYSQRKSTKLTAINKSKAAMEYRTVASTAVKKTQLVPVLFACCITYIDLS